MKREWFEAIRKNDVETVERLIKSGFPADTQEESPEYETGLIIAAKHNFVEIAKLLLDFGANIEKSDSMRQSAFIHACENGNFEMVEFLFKRGADIHVKNAFNETAFFLACQNGNVSIVRFFLKEKTNFALKNDIGYSALSTASFNGRLEVVKELVSNKIFDLLENDSGWDAFFGACCNQHEETIRYFLEFYKDSYNKEGLKKGNKGKLKYMKQQILSGIREYMNFPKMNSSFIEYLMESLGMEELEQYLNNSSVVEWLEANPDKKKIWNKCKDNCWARIRVSESLSQKKKIDSNIDCFER